jgi:integrase
VHTVEAGKPTGLFTVDDAFSLYRTSLERAGRASAAMNARSKYEASIKSKLGAKEAAKITTEQFEDWRDGIVKAPPRLRTKPGEPPKFREVNPSPEGLRKRQASANRVWTTLKAALNVSFRAGRIASDAAWKKLKAFDDFDGVRLDYLSIAETVRINNAADPEFRPLLHAGLLTGGRWGSIAELTVGDFHPDAGTVAFRTRKGKGSVKVYHCHLTPEGVAFFKAACARRSGASTLIFTHADSSPWKAGDQLQPMKEAVERARIGRSITFYHLRHTWASHAVMNGTPLMVVAQNLGHSDTRMVEKHYGHLAPSYRKQEILKGAPVFGIEPDNAVL